MSGIATVGRATIHVSATREEMGRLAGLQVAEEIRRRLRAQPVVRMVFAAAPSQSEMLHALGDADGVDWSRVEAFHMDEYIGLPVGARQRFGEWLKREFFDRVRLRGVHLDRAGRGCRAMRGCVCGAAGRAADRHGVPGDWNERAYCVQRSAGGLQRTA